MENKIKVLLGVLLLSMLAFPGVATPTTFVAPVTEGLVVYYDGNLSGNSLVDLSENNNIGYATNVTPGTNSITGANYINLNGVNSKIDVSNNAQTNISSSVSIEFIGSINNFRQYGALASTYNDGELGWYLACSSASPYNRARLGAATSDGFKNCESDAGLVAGQVYHIVATYDNSTVRIYIDGEESGSSTWNSPIIGSPENITIGGYGSSSGGLNYCNCSMYTFRLYNRSLSSDEVLQNYKYDRWRITNKTIPAITWNVPANITYGTALNETQLNSIATDPLTGDTVNGSFVYTPASGTVLNVGTHTLHVDFTPTDTANYTNTTANVTINVTTKVTPIVTWNTPADITSGTALSETQLNAVATDPVTGNSVAGSFVYTPAAGTVLSAGTHILYADFKPTDTEKYNNASKDVIINVSGETPVANFNANPTKGTAPLTVQFTDLSENAAGWSWDFGDGNSSTEQNPVHTYSAAGNYTVRLNVSNAYGYNISTKPDLISVTGYVTDGLVAYYDGNLSGNSLVDLSGNNNVGYATNVTPGTNQATGAKYVNLNGVNSKIDVSSNAQTNISSPVTIEFYGSINNFTRYGAVVSKQKDWVSDWYLACSSASPYNRARLGAATSDGFKNCESDAGLVAGQVYHIVATYDNSTVRIYIDGEESGSSTWNSPIIGSPENITIGSGSGLNYCNCSMYTFRLYNRSLSSDEILQNYNNCIYVPIVPDPDPNITMIKKLAYGDQGLPRYMGSHAMSQSGSGVSLVDSNLSSLGSVLTPYYQDNGSAEANYILVNSSVSGVKWKNYYARGSSASLSFSGNNRTRLENLSLSNNSLHLSNSVTYTGDTLVTKEAVPVTGNGFQFYGDGLNTISRSSVQGYTVQAYTDNGEIQKDTIIIKNSPGMSPGGILIDNEYQNRTAGTTRSNSVDLPLSSPQLTPMPCPGGYLGSLSFAIHADAQDPDSLKTMMYGTNDINNPEYGTKGYIGHGLICTWSAFAASSGDAGIGFDNVSFNSTLGDMYAHGFEIVPHNVIGWAGEGNPTRNTTGYYLPWYTSNYSSRNWIDHGLNGGNRNTGLKSLGLDKNSPQYYIGDLLREHGIEYAWAYQDITLRSDAPRDISTSRTQSLGLPYDIVWTNTNFTWDDGTPMYEWTSTWAYDKTALDYFNNTTLQAMIDSYGVCFWHDYTAQNDETFEGYYYTKGNPYRIDETYDDLLLNTSEQKEAGRLWNPTVSQYIDYWRAACNVECKCTGQDAYTLVNHNSETVPGYAMRVAGSYSVKLDGNELETKKNGNNTVFWMELSPGTHLLTLVRS